MATTTVIECSPPVSQQDIEEILRTFSYSKHIVRNGKHFIIGNGKISRKELPFIHDSFTLKYVDSPFPLCSQEFQAKKSVVKVRDIEIGNGSPVIIAGPCSVESREQILTISTNLAAAGCHILRGGAFKPRTSPYSFQGLGHDGLKLLAEAREMSGLPFVTEVLTPVDVELVAGYADMLQIGARNMQNFALLREVGRTKKPVLLKRAPWADVVTWLQAAEYILAEGNFEVVLCERGIAATQASSGRHLDLAAVHKVQNLSHLPMIVDPSHGTGDRRLVGPMALASLEAGCDGLMLEVHHQPETSLSDKEQAISLEDYDGMLKKIKLLNSQMFVDPIKA
ncbi:3-deoxy-7-phosphoheptulonate synthase [Brevibacillus ruminantium]|uniref:3-deoxy-7-phosphoheptulonate synthase n=1 Tax=Brevibacillus ruminantium TaxID=2950604 RepID=A0ABY4WC28_9BACL|nr:3-deoxy-7-phosphoheptulonate synthase [Brevibacillus ruminantium]USG64612.1 3-deoxy-7-phosphoheptulonate synthase [Brevibacillus ruminantium]